MAYVIEFKRYGDGFNLSSMLHDWSVAEIEWATAKSTDDHWFTRIGAKDAYAWVRRDRPHSTTLYVDLDGRVRKGKDLIPTYDYRVGLYAAGSKTPNDYMGFFPTRQMAEDAACTEISRVAAMDPADRDIGLDWAVRYSIKKFKRP